MAGCGSSACGIQKGREKEQASAQRAALWARTHGKPSRSSALEDIQALGDYLETLLPLRAFVRPAETDHGCDWLYLLAGIHPRALIEFADGLLEPAEAPFRIQEHYLRLGISPWGPFVTMQEVHLSWRNEDPTEPPSILSNYRKTAAVTSPAFLVEEPKIGVEDQRLRYLVKGLQGALRQQRWIVLDAAFLLQDSARLWYDLFDANPAETICVTPLSSQSSNQ